MSGTRRKAGLLGPQVEGYRAWLARRGYTPGTVRNMLKDLGQVGLWLSSEGLEAAQLDEDLMVVFLTGRQAVGRRRVPGLRGMVPLLSYLREVGLTPAAKSPHTPLETLLGWYRAGEDVQAKVPSLSTYLGHREPASTYWYLSAAPELLSLAAGRQNTAWSAVKS